MNKITKIMIPAFTKADFTGNKFMSKTKQDVKYLIERLLCAKYRSQLNVNTLSSKIVSITFEYFCLKCNKSNMLYQLKKF